MTNTLPNNLGFLNPYVIEDLIRVGNKGDGGYVIPRSIITMVDTLLAFGVNRDWSFEREFLQLNPTVIIHAYDHTIGKDVFWKDLRRSVERLLWLKSGSFKRTVDSFRIYRDYSSFFVGSSKHFQERIFNRLENPNDATMEKVFLRVPESKNVMVKMDIEGSEYRVIRQLLDYHEKVVLLAIEFHETDPYRLVFIDSVRAICEHYNIVHIHGNNDAGKAADGLPETLEITFLNKNIPVSQERRNCLPIPGLDFPNDSRKPDHPMIFV